MAQNYMTPGVYIEEVNAFPGSVVEVATAIPAFIGYTNEASVKGKTLLNQPVRITSMEEYHEFFGKEFDPKFKLTLDKTNAAEADAESSKHQIIIGENTLTIEYEANQDLIFYNSLKLFYANGGSACYIVSVGLIEEGKGVKIDGEKLIAGLEPLKKEQEPTMIVIPEAVKLGSKGYDVYKQVLVHCSAMQSRVAILDVIDGDWSRFSDNEDGNVDTFRENIGSEYLDYAAAYHPWLNTNIVDNRDITFTNFGADDKNSLGKLSELIPEDEKSAVTIIGGYPKEDAQIEAKYKEEKSVDKVDSEALEVFIKNLQNNLHLGLIATSPTYKSILAKLREVINLLPPSSAMAGVYTMVDTNRGVWKSPANISLNGVIKPSTTISHDDQEQLNVDAIGGKSINAIRTFPHLGTLVGW